MKPSRFFLAIPFCALAFNCASNSKPGSAELQSAFNRSFIVVEGDSTLDGFRIARQSGRNPSREEYLAVVKGTNPQVQKELDRVSGTRNFQQYLSEKEKGAEIELVSNDRNELYSIATSLNEAAEKISN